MALACHAVFDSLLLDSDTAARLAPVHLAGLTISLNQRLSTRAQSLEDATVASLICILVASCIARNYEFALMHMVGLRYIFRLRGGLKGFADSPHLIVGMAK